MPVHREGVVLSYGTLETKKAFEIQVESDVVEMTLFAAIQRKDLAVLIRPDASMARDREPGVALQIFQHMLIATVTSPPAGVWRLELNGEGVYAVTAHVKPGKNGPELIAFDFVEPGGRPGHEGMFPVRRGVRAGESLACRIELSGSVKEAELDFVARDGSQIGTIAMTPASEDEYTARCTIPAPPFRVVVRGIDATGMRFQRIESGLRTPIMP